MGTLSAYQGEGSNFSGKTVLSVVLYYGYFGEARTLADEVYVDDVTIAGTTYDLELPPSTP